MNMARSPHLYGPENVHSAWYSDCNMMSKAAKRWTNRNTHMSPRWRSRDRGGVGVFPRRG